MFKRHVILLSTVLTLFIFIGCKQTNTVYRSAVDGVESFVATHFDLSGWHRLSPREKPAENPEETASEIPAGRRQRGTISVYDNLIKEVARREGYDWRFLSAIAYHESRFNDSIVSSKGACGLMQIMPVVARQFEVPQEEVIKPEVNVLLGAKLLRRIERSLKLPESVSPDDRMKIVLACYNGGIGHVTDARRLAAKYGQDPNSWDDVSYFLQMKADPQYHEDEVVKCGLFRGSKQTLAFVNNVMSKYDNYRLTVRE